jgi:hypothetical protein
MRAVDIIQRLIDKNNYKNYLEIGTREGRTFNKINCSHKIGVDLDKEAVATHFMPSDAFFENNTEEFDIIFIDGDHEEHQVMSDVLNALDALAVGGTIVMHDCNPINEWRQRPKSEFVTGQNWNGTVWRAYVRLRTRDDLSMYVIDTDEGIGIIQRGCQKPITYKEPLDYEMFSECRNYLLNLISLDQWLNSHAK